MHPTFPPDTWGYPPHIWGAYVHQSLIPDPGWWRKQDGVVGGASFNPYTKSYPPRHTELDFRSTPLSNWTKK